MALAVHISFHALSHCPGFGIAEVTLTTDFLAFLPFTRQRYSPKACASEAKSARSENAYKIKARL
jgi:hypothetical protein